MYDILSLYCELPTGVYHLEFLPRHEIVGWEGALPIPMNRWYGIGVYRGSLTFEQPTVVGDQGATHSVAVSCLVVNDSQEVGAQISQMENMRFVLRVHHYDGKRRIVGSPNQYCSLVQTDFSAPELIGVQGYRLNFAGDFSHKPIVY